MDRRRYRRARAAPSPRDHDDPPTTRKSVERLLGLDFEILCFDHGTPLYEEPKAAIRALLERTAG